MPSWKPSGTLATPCTLLTATTARMNGVLVKSYTPGRAFPACVRSFGGTEVEKDGQLVVEDTIRVETWYAPDITAGAAIRLDEDGSVWEVLGTPEDISMRHQYMTFKARRAKGGA